MNFGVQMMCKGKYASLLCVILFIILSILLLCVRCFVCKKAKQEHYRSHDAFRLTRCKQSNLIKKYHLLSEHNLLLF